MNFPFLSFPRTRAQLRKLNLKAVLLKMTVSFTWGKESSANGSKKMVDLRSSSRYHPFAISSGPGTKQKKTTLHLASPKGVSTFSPTAICVWEITSGQMWAMLAGPHKSRCWINHFGPLTSKVGRRAEWCHSLPDIWQTERQQMQFWHLFLCSVLA